MSDDSFIREVEEELRSDQLKGFWDRYKYIIIGGAVLIVAATAGYRAWLFYTQSQAAQSGDRFIEAVELSNDGKHDDAIVALQALASDGSGEYPALAKIRLAAEFAKNDEPQKAIEAFDTIAADSGFDQTLRNVARLRAGLLLVDHGSYDDVVNRLNQMSNDGNPFRHSSREGLGLSAWKQSKYEDALNWFSIILEDAQAPQGVRQRAEIMIELLAGKGYHREEEAQTG